MEASRIPHSFDFQFARDIVAGNVAAWHEFVQRYSGLVFSMIRRYLADVDDEAQRDAYVDALEYMYATGLARYDGRAALSTWVMAISRSRALDQRRALRGRKRDPAWLTKVSMRDREVFRLYYEEGADVAATRDRLAARGVEVSCADVCDALDRLEARMDRRVRTRLAYDLQARSIGAASGSLLDFLDHLRHEHAVAAEALRPDVILIERRARRLLDRLESALQRLDTEERRIVELHYFGARTAQQIAADLGLKGPRRVYTLLDRAIKRLRQFVCGTGEERRAAGAGEYRREAIID